MWRWGTLWLTTLFKATNAPWALIVLRPRKLTDGTPVATVSYGFRGPDSIGQAIHDAVYKGPTNLPYYPK